jgi:hypothetical protein
MGKKFLKKPSELEYRLSSLAQTTNTAASKLDGPAVGINKPLSQAP